MGCTSYSNGRAPAGCVATAVGQVMKYHGFPNTYNWAGMRNIGGSTLTSALLRDIGDAVDMNYGCSGSGAITQDPVNVLKNLYGYQSASFADWQFHPVKTNLNAARPVILSAKRTENCFLVWCIATNGHAWVVDGYIENEVWDAACQSGTVYVSLHMNWGWGGTHDGWFSYSNWNPGGTGYIYNKQMIYNIYP